MDLLGKTGFVLVAIGTALADSECLLVPALIMGLGAFLLYKVYL